MGYNFDDFIHFFGRHAQVARDPGVSDWIARHGADAWHETHVRDGRRTIVLQSRDRSRLLALLVDQAIGADGSMTETIEQRADFDLATRRTLTSEIDAVRAVEASAPGVTEHVQAVRPVVDFNQTPPSLSWEVETFTRERIAIFAVTPEVRMIDTRDRPQLLDAAPPRRVERLVDDSLESNELHHLDNAWIANTAREWTAGATTTYDKAKMIWMKTSDKMAYDLTIKWIRHFTWADLLIVGQLGWCGICDEFAVIQISMLRALGIPASMRFLNWTRPGTNVVAHACLEWLDGGTWRHMDALWHAFDDRTVYRRGGAQQVRVMNATYPRDGRSDDAAWGVPDPDGDLRIHPYNDYVLTPPAPGEERPGYSY